MNSFDNKKFGERVKKPEILLRFPMKSLSFMSAQGIYTHKKSVRMEKEICVRSFLSTSSGQL